MTKRPGRTSSGSGEFDPAGVAAIDRPLSPGLHDRRLYRGSRRLCPRDVNDGNHPA